MTLQLKLQLSRSWMINMAWFLFLQIQVKVHIFVKTNDQFTFSKKHASWQQHAESKSIRLVV